MLNKTILPYNSSSNRKNWREDQGESKKCCYTMASCMTGWPQADINVWSKGSSIAKKRIYAIKRGTCKSTCRFSDLGCGYIETSNSATFQLYNLIHTCTLDFMYTSRLHLYALCLSSFRAIVIIIAMQISNIIFNVALYCCSNYRNSAWQRNIMVTSKWLHLQWKQ